MLQEQHATQHSMRAWTLHVLEADFLILQLVLMSLALCCRVPGLLEQIIKPPMRGAGLTIYIQLYNSIFFFVFACVLYAVVSRTRQAALVSQFALP